MNREQVLNWIAGAFTDLKAAQAAQDAAEIVEHLNDAKASIDRAIDHAEAEA